jgi:hypothetical protein
MYHSRHAAAHQELTSTEADLESCPVIFMSKPFAAEAKDSDKVTEEITSPYDKDSGVVAVEEGKTNEDEKEETMVLGAGGSGSLMGSPSGSRDFDATTAAHDLPDDDSEGRRSLNLGIDLAKEGDSSSKSGKKTK